MASQPTRAPIAPAKHLKLNNSGGWDVTIPILPSPDKTWIEMFEAKTSPYFSVSSKYGGYKIRNGSVEWTSSEEMLYAQLDDLDQRIAGTNKWYADDLAAKQAKDEQRRQMEEKRAEDFAEKTKKYDGR